MIRGTLEHGYAVLDDYRHMRITVNEGSKTSLKLDDKGRYDELTSNIAESVNAMFNEAR
ncbi:hypothetical protein H5410_040059 [Solanum commersonii]|uniref:Uncharacterized protein n=1 Tax=Solanum commersonii TaxID=4109 RepID=A0A9J5XMT3_SOLCO|nr:hypothetical protein H5410_040059 [Solanum commersonii]